MGNLDMWVRLSTILVVLASISIGGCAPSSVSQADLAKKVEAGNTDLTNREKRALLKRARQNGDIVVSAGIEDALNVKTVVVGPVLFSSKSSVEQRAEFPVHVLYELKDSPETRLIKQAGDIVYIEAAPFIKVVGEFKNGKTGTLEKGLGQPPKFDSVFKGCDEAYLVALAPENNYRISYSYDKEFRIRAENVAAFGGWGNSVIRDLRPGGKLFQASLKPIKASFRGTCYFTGTKHLF